MPDQTGLLFRECTHHRPILVSLEDSDHGSRIGGRPPAPLATTPPVCPVCGGALRYVLTLAADTLGDAIAGGRAVSLLACRDYGCLVTSHGLTRPSSTVLVAHDDAPRATVASVIDTVTEGRRLVLGDAAADPTRDGWVETDASKLGGQPGYIQSWGPEEAEKAAGAGFLFQWSENSLATSRLKSGPAVFDFGVVYVFGRLDAASGLPALEDLTAFWQSS